MSWKHVSIPFFTNSQFNHIKPQLTNVVSPLNSCLVESVTPDWNWLHRFCSNKHTERRKKFPMRWNNSWNCKTCYMKFTEPNLNIWHSTLIILIGMLLIVQSSLFRRNVSESVAYRFLHPYSNVWNNWFFSLSICMHHRFF